MANFFGNPEYVGKSGAAGGEVRAGGYAPIGMWYGQPDYLVSGTVADPSQLPATKGLPMAQIDLTCPAIDSTGSATVNGAPIVFLAPAGAQRFRAWFSPARAQYSGSAVGATLIATSAPWTGTVDGGQVVVTPVWQRLGAYAVEANTVKATLLVTFE